MSPVYETRESFRFRRKGHEPILFHTLSMKIIRGKFARVPISGPSPRHDRSGDLLHISMDINPLLGCLVGNILDPLIYPVASLPKISETSLRQQLLRIPQWRRHSKSPWERGLSHQHFTRILPSFLKKQVFVQLVCYKLRRKKNLKYPQVLPLFFRILSFHF